jgi:hypothetical protein
MGRRSNISTNTPSLPTPFFFWEASITHTTLTFSHDGQLTFTVVAGKLYKNIVSESITESNKTVIG